MPGHRARRGLRRRRRARAGLRRALGRAGVHRPGARCWPSRRRRSSASRRRTRTHAELVEAASARRRPRGAGREAARARRRPRPRRWSSSRSSAARCSPSTTRAASCPRSARCAADTTLGALQHVSGVYVKGLKHNGTHWLDLLRLLAGEPVEVRGWDRLRRGRRGPDARRRADARPGAGARLAGLDTDRFTAFEMDLWFTGARVRVAEGGHVLERWDVGADPRHPGYRVLLPRPVQRGALRDGVLHAVQDVVRCVREGGDAGLHGRRRGARARAGRRDPRLGRSTLHAMTTATGALGIHGGTPVRSRPFPPPPALGPAEKAAVNEVLDSGVLSQFVGRLGRRLLRRPARARARARLGAALRGQARGLDELGDLGAQRRRDRGRRRSGRRGHRLALHDVRVGGRARWSTARSRSSPTSSRTRSASTPSRCAACINARTKAIVAVDLFGCPADFERADGDRRRARPGRHRGRRAGARARAAAGARPARSAHIGVFSLNYHKTIQCGEGGVAVTDDDRLAERLALVRNHGEAVVGRHGLRRLRRARLQLPHG